MTVFNLTKEDLAKVVKNPTTCLDCGQLINIYTCELVKNGEFLAVICPNCTKIRLERLHD